MIKNTKILTLTTMLMLSFFTDTMYSMAISQPRVTRNETTDLISFTEKTPSQSKIEIVSYNKKTGEYGGVIASEKPIIGWAHDESYDGPRAEYVFKLLKDKYSGTEIETETETVKEN